MRGWDDLQDLGAFMFEEAREEGRRLFAPLGADIDAFAPDSAELVTYDSVLLGAASITLALDGTLNTDRPKLPLRVPAPAVRLAFRKVDCSGTWIHVLRNLDELQLWDIMVFSGDMSKSTAIGATTVRQLTENFDTFFDALFKAFQQGWSPDAPAIAESGRLHLDALIWQAQLWRLVEPVEIRPRLRAFAEANSAHLPLPMAPA